MSMPTTENPPIEVTYVMLTQREFAGFFGRFLGCRLSREEFVRFFGRPSHALDPGEVDVTDQQQNRSLRVDLCPTQTEPSTPSGAVDEFAEFLDAEWSRRCDRVDILSPEDGDTIVSIDNAGLFLVSMTLLAVGLVAIGFGLLLDDGRTTFVAWVSSMILYLACIAAMFRDQAR
jgi:hypothetical protein